jgi:hypothetical protein
MKKYGFSFSWKRALGITSVKQKIARETGIPTTINGMERKVGRSVLNMIFGALFKKNKKIN